MTPSPDVAGDYVTIDQVVTETEQVVVEVERLRAENAELRAEVERLRKAARPRPAARRERD